MKVQAKAKRKKAIKKIFDPSEQKLSEREIKKGIADLDERTDERYEFAMQIFNAQSNAMKEIIELMIDRMRSMTGEPARLYYKGVPVNALDESAVKRMQEKTFYWIAIRLLVAWGKWDIQVGDFHLPKDICATCGVEV